MKSAPSRIPRSRSAARIKIPRRAAFKVAIAGIS
jgi:hypothetical protein